MPEKRQHPKVPEAQECVRQLLEHLGFDVGDPGLKDTPRRVVAALQEMTSGYAESPAKHLEVVFDQKFDSIVVLKDTPFISLCEHHLLPFEGKVHIAYLPKNKVVGLSKLARVTDVFAKRLQLQERMTIQIAQTIDECLDPRGVFVIAEATHSCMTCRGPKKTGSVMLTSAVLGVFRDSGDIRSEAMRLMRC